MKKTNKKLIVAMLLLFGTSAIGSQLCATTQEELAEQQAMEEATTLRQTCLTILSSLSNYIKTLTNLTAINQKPKYTKRKKLATWFCDLFQKPLKWAQDDMNEIENKRKKRSKG